ncbi:MAG TPA: type II secretion system F family protein [Veillonellaceae bacterium]|nr:type II secretion system F family protein [Veillonellaceae bacterium]
MILLISLLCSFLVFIMIFFSSMHLLKKTTRVSDRVRFYTGYAPEEEEKQEKNELKTRLRKAFRKRLRETAPKKNAMNLNLLMDRAGLPILGSEFLIMSNGAAVIGFIIGFLLFSNVISGLVLSLIVLSCAWGYVRYLASRNSKKFTGQLSDCLTLLANALRAGFSFLQAMEILSREMQPPMSTEFARVLRETNLGKPLEQALQQMDERVDNEDFSLVITAVLIQQQVGGNLAEIIDTIRDTIIERVRLRREITTLTAQGRATGMVLAVIPIGMAIALYAISPTYIEPLLTTTIGRLAIGAAVVLEIIGFIIIYKIMDIKI